MLGLSLLAAATHCSTDPGTPPGDTDGGSDAASDASVDATVDDRVEAWDGNVDATDAPTDTPDSGSDAAVDAPDDAISDAATDASNPRCDAPANLFDPGDQCGLPIAVSLECSHSITQKAMSAGCCVPKNPGVACVPTATLDSNCCVNPGIYCGLVEQTTHTVPVSLTLTRGARSGIQICQFGTTTLSTTKVVVSPLTGPKAGITLALSIFEKPRCSGGSYTASFTRVDTAESYSGTWIDHPSVSQNRDSSGSASVTIHPDGSITYDATGTVPMDTGSGTPTWIRRTHVATCTATTAPPGTKE